MQFALLFVIPVFGAMFADFGPKLPAPTQLLLDCSDFFKSYWWGLNPGLAVAVTVLSVNIANQETMRKWLKWILVIQFVMLFVMIVSMALPIFQLASVAKDV